MEPDRTFANDGVTAGWFRMADGQSVRVEKTPRSHIVSWTTSDGLVAIQNAIRSGHVIPSEITTVTKQARVASKTKLTDRMVHSDLALVRVNADDLSVVWESGEVHNELAVVSTSWDRVESTVRSLGQILVADQVPAMVEALLHD